MNQILINAEHNCDTNLCPQDEDPPSWVSACLQIPQVKNSLDTRIPHFTILYAEADEAQELNAQYRDKDYATNVLSFPAELPDFIQTLEDGFTLGDLVICPEVVIRQAKEQHKPLEHHYAHLIIHGFLHLLDFDHIDDEDAQVMESIEIEALKTLGIPNPYEDQEVSVAELDLS